MLNDYSSHIHESELALTESSESKDKPFATEFIHVSRQEIIQLKAERNQYKSLHERALLKIKALEEELALEKGKVRDLNYPPVSG